MKQMLLRDDGLSYQVSSENASLRYIYFFIFLARFFLSRLLPYHSTHLRYKRLVAVLVDCAIVRVCVCLLNVIGFSSIIKDECS